MFFIWNIILSFFMFMVILQMHNFELILYIFLVCVTLICKFGYFRCFGFTLWRFCCLVSLGMLRGISQRAKPEGSVKEQPFQPKETLSFLTLFLRIAFNFQYFLTFPNTGKSGGAEIFFARQMKPTSHANRKLNNNFYFVIFCEESFYNMSIC